MRYAIVIEKGQTSYGAYVPDPPCAAVGETIGEIRALIQEAIVFHLEELREDELRIPEPLSISEYVGWVRVRSRLSLLVYSALFRGKTTA